MRSKLSFMLSSFCPKGSTLRAYVMCCQDPRSIEELLRYPEHDSYFFHTGG